MGIKFRELTILLTVLAVVLSDPINKTAKSFEDYADQEEVLFNEDKPCPRDCICTASKDYRIAKCNRLELGTQKFGDDITDLVVESLEPNFPIDLDDYIFKDLGLHQITTIKIVNTPIGKVGKNAFHGLHELYAVNLSHTKLSKLHPETFVNNKKLILLTLANNPLEFPTPETENYFLNTSTVQELDVSYCNIENISPNAFKNLPGLMYLNLAGNNLSYIYTDTFKTLLDLEELDLSDNNITHIPSDLFSKNGELATLHIQRNPISSVFGLQIPDLLTLNAGQTNIPTVGPSMLQGMSYIANLNLSGSGITKIHNQAFHKLNELNYLDLSYNNLDFMSSILIKNNIDLDIFKISNNPNLKHLPENGFECSADQFNIYLFDASNCGLEEISDNALSTFTSLSQINLSGNKIKSISPKVFSKSPKLVDINLSHNLLTTLDDKVFEQNKELGKLNLQGNPLKVFSIEVFVHTPVMTWLDMSHTELTALWKGDKSRSVSLFKNLSYLNVSNCRLTEIKQDDLQNSTKLRTLDISNNPLACNREFENLLTWLNKQKVLPYANTESIANLSKEPKLETESSSTWEKLSQKICGNAIQHFVEPISNAVSDEEIWERVDEDAEGNFDLKDTLDDDEKPEDDKLTELDDNDENEDADDDDDDDEEDEDDASEDYDDDIDLKVKLNEKPKKLPKILPTEVKTEKVDINIKLLENDMYDDNLNQDIYVQATLAEEDNGTYRYLPILIALLSALLLLLVTGKLVMFLCVRRNKQVRYNNAIIAAMSQPGRTKKDCGLVYQQLSEELTGPATPKHNRYTPLPVTVNASNICENSSFHHKNIVPESV